VITHSTDKVVKAETNVQILTNGLVEEIPMSVSLKEKSQEHTAFSVETKLLKEPKVFVVLKKQEAKVAAATDKEIQVKGSVVLEILTKEMLPISFPASVINASITEATKKLVIVFEGPLSAQGAVDLEITHNTLFTAKKTIVQLKADYPSKQVELGVVENKAALSIDLTDAIKNEFKKKNMKLKLSLSAQLNLQGTLMNTTLPDTSKLFEGSFVELK
jgi:hypothetical protein